MHKISTNFCKYKINNINYIKISFQIALYKFVRLAGDMLPPPLFVPYHQMLTSLSSSLTSAHNCFVMLKMNGKNGNYSTLDVISFNTFYSSLFQIIYILDFVLRFRTVKLPSSYLFFI